MLKGDLKKGRVRGYAVLRQRALYTTLYGTENFYLGKIAASMEQ